MKLKAARPRNPLIVLMRQRNGAGVHQKPHKAQRQAARQQLHKQLTSGTDFAQRLLREP